MLRLEYKPNERARAWRRSSLTMHAEGRANMQATARALTIQEGWHAWRIVEESAQ
jgi:hypothetical protein